MKNPSNIFHCLLPPEYSAKHLHPRTLANLNEWIDLNSELPLDRHIHDHDEARSFIKDNFDNELLSYFNLQPDGRFKADLWRLCVLYIHGGIYADIDQKLLSPLNLFLDIDKYSFSGVSNMERYNLSNGFIYSLPNHPIIKKNIELTYKRYNHALNNPYLLSNVEFIGGCYIMGAAISDLISDKVMPIGAFNIDGDSCLFLHEKGDTSLRDKDKQAFWNSFGVYSDKGERVMDSRYSSYHVDRHLRHEFITINQ